MQVREYYETVFRENWNDLTCILSKRKLNDYDKAHFYVTPHSQVLLTVVDNLTH